MGFQTRYKPTVGGCDSQAPREAQAPGGGNVRIEETEGDITGMFLMG